MGAALLLLGAVVLGTAEDEDELDAFGTQAQGVAFGHAEGSGAIVDVRYCVS